MAFSTRGWRIIFGTRQSSSSRGMSAAKEKAPERRIRWISMYRSRMATSRRRGTNSSGEMQKRRMSARLVDMRATWGTSLILLIHFMVSRVLQRKWGFSWAWSMRIWAWLSSRWFSTSSCWLCLRATSIPLNRRASSPSSSSRWAGTVTSKLFRSTSPMAERRRWMGWNICRLSVRLISTEMPTQNRALPALTV